MRDYSDLHPLRQSQDIPKNGRRPDMKPSTSDDRPGDVLGSEKRHAAQFPSHAELMQEDTRNRNGMSVESTARSGSHFDDGQRRNTPRPSSYRIPPAVPLCLILHRYT